MIEKPYQIRLEKIFEGPMDLLIHLIRKKYLDITSIDSIPTGMIVKKPNIPFKPLITNKSTLNVEYFALNNYVL
mgnify:CR=1 FL=1